MKKTGKKVIKVSTTKKFATWLLREQKIYLVENNFGGQWYLWWKSIFLGWHYVPQSNDGYLWIMKKDDIFLAHTPSHKTRVVKPSRVWLEVLRSCLLGPVIQFTGLFFYHVIETLAGDFSLTTHITLRDGCYWELLEDKSLQSHSIYAICLCTLFTCRYDVYQDASIEGPNSFPRHESTTELHRGKYNQARSCDCSGCSNSSRNISSSSNSRSNRSSREYWYPLVEVFIVVVEVIVNSLSSVSISKSLIWTTKKKIEQERWAG